MLSRVLFVALALFLFISAVSGTAYSSSSSSSGSSSTGSSSSSSSSSLESASSSSSSSEVSSSSSSEATSSPVSSSVVSSSTSSPVSSSSVSSSSVSSSSSPSTGSTGTSATGTSATGTSSYNSTVSSSSSSYVAAATIPTGSIQIVFVVNLTNVPTGEVSSSSPLIQNLTIIIAANLAILADANGLHNYNYTTFLPYVFITYIGSYEVGYVYNRRLLQTGTDVTFNIVPAVSNAVGSTNASALASSFAAAALIGNLTSTVSGVSVPGLAIAPQMVTTVVVTNTPSSSSSTGEGNNNAAFATVSKQSPVIAVIAAVAAIASMLL